MKSTKSLLLDFSYKQAPDMFHHVCSTDKLHLRPPECDEFFLCESVDANCAKESIGLNGGFMALFLDVPIVCI